MTTPTATTSCLIDASLASGTKSGYTFTYTPVPTGVVISSYTVNADPTSSSTSGARHFFTDETNVIRVNAFATAANTDPPI